MNACVKAKADESMERKHLVVKISHNHSCKTERKSQQFSWRVCILELGFLICCWALSFSFRVFPFLFIFQLSISLCMSSLFFLSSGPCQTPIPCVPLSIHLPLFYRCLPQLSWGRWTDSQTDKWHDMYVSEQCEEAWDWCEKLNGASYLAVNS